MYQDAYGATQTVWNDVHEMFRSEHRINVPDAAEKFRYLYDPVSYTHLTLPTILRV